MAAPTNKSEGICDVVMLWDFIHFTMLLHVHYWLTLSLSLIGNKIESLINHARDFGIMIFDSKIRAILFMLILCRCKLIWTYPTQHNLFEGLWGFILKDHLKGCELAPLSCEGPSSPLYDVIHLLQLMHSSIEKAKKYFLWTMAKRIFFLFPSGRHTSREVPS